MGRSIIAWLMATLLIVGCSAAGDDGSVALGAEFTLELGETARVEGAGIDILFSEIANESRCAQGLQCIVAGDVTVRILIEGEARGPMAFEELVWPGPGATVDSGGFRIRVVSVSPDPPPQEFVPLGEYEATFVVTDA